MSDTGLEHFLVDENPAALPAHEIAVRDQLLVGGDHGISRHIELLCELAAGWQFHARRERAIQNAVHEPLTNLVLQIHRLIRVDIDNRVWHWITHRESGSKLPQIPQKTKKS